MLVTTTIIHNRGVGSMQFDVGPANPFLFPSLPHIHFLLSPFVVVGPSFFPPLSILPLPSIFASLPLEVGLRLKSSQRVRSGAPAEIEFGAFSH